MIQEVDTNLFELNVNALAQGCNVVGTMNAGVAREFRTRYPLMYKEYQSYCRSGNFSPGEVHFYMSRGGKPHIINVATQFDTESNAIIEYVEQGLEKIEMHYKDWGIRSLGIPRIGCGLGGLDWKDVSKIVKKIFGTSQLEVLVSSGQSV